MIQSLDECARLQGFSTSSDVGKKPRRDVKCKAIRHHLQFRIKEKSELLQLEEFAQTTQIVNHCDTSKI